MKIVLELTAYELNTLRGTLIEEVDRNMDYYPDINEACESVLKQLEGV